MGQRKVELTTPDRLSHLYKIPFPSSKRAAAMTPHKPGPACTETERKGAQMVNKACVRVCVCVCVCVYNPAFAEASGVSSVKRFGCRTSNLPVKSICQQKQPSPPTAARTLHQFCSLQYRDIFMSLHRNGGHVPERRVRTCRGVQRVINADPEHRPLGSQEAETSNHSDHHRRPRAVHVTAGANCHLKVALVSHITEEEQM